MRKASEPRYLVGDVVSIPVVRLPYKGEAYRMATKPGWGLVDWYGEVTDTDCIGRVRTRMVPVNRDRSDKTQVMYCDEDSSGTLYSRYGREYTIAPYEEINLKEAPGQSETAAIILSDCCGFTFWEEEPGNVKIFVTFDKNGLIDSYRLDNWAGKPYDGETEVPFEDLQSAQEHESTDRADIPGTYEYECRMRKAGQEQQF